MKKSNIIVPSSNGYRKDVTIVAPPAVASSTPVPVTTPEISAEDIIRMQNAENNQLRREIQELRITASSIANIAISFARMLEDHKLPTVVPRWLSDKMIGAKITLHETSEGDIAVQIRERGEYPVEIEG